MNVACNECQSVYRVDPAKVTRENLRARCSVCGAIIAVGASVRWADAFSDVPSPSAPILDAPLSGSPAVPRETAVAPVHGQAPNDRRTPAGQQPVVPTQPPLPSAAELTASFRAPQAFHRA